MKTYFVFSMEGDFTSNVVRINEIEMKLILDSCEIGLEGLSHASVPNLSKSEYKLREIKDL